MATIGLNVQESPLGGSLSLADTLAKGIFGDPDGQMKARALASQILAHQAYATKLGADASLVNEHLTEDQRAEAERLRAGPAIGEASAAAVPMPVPVEASRANAPGTTGYGPQPGIIDPAALRTHDALAARERALGPILSPQQTRGHRQSRRRGLRWDDPGWRGVQSGYRQPRHPAPGQHALHRVRSDHVHGHDYRRLRWRRCSDAREDP